MQNRLVGLGSAVVLASTMATLGCSTRPSGGGTGGGGEGAVGTGGSSGTGGGSCTNGTPCGGDVVGTWTATSSCLKITGVLDPSVFGAGCTSAPVAGSLHVTGALTVNPDGTYSDDTTTSGDEAFTLSPSCLVISSAPVTCTGAASLLTSVGYSSLHCTDVAGGGCNCSGTVQETGALGFVSPTPTTSGNYTTKGNLITISRDVGDTTYAYCVSGSTLTLTPQSTKPTVTGTVVLQKSASSGLGGGGGAGGASGQAGAGGQGGAAGSGGTNGAGASTGSGGTRDGGGAADSGGSAGSGDAGGATAPCDLYRGGGTPCIAAHSTVRALFGAYSGKLYQVRNSAGATKDILTLSPGGFADGPSQDTFCAGTTCVITVVYDQSGHGNDLWYQGSTMVPASTSSSAARATTESLTLNGHKVYSLYINPGNSYWVDASRSGIATGSQPEGLYMVTSGKHFNSGCCFDYGNSETDRSADGAGTMDAINFSTITAWGTGAGTGPWVMADLEFGIFTQGGNGFSRNPNNPTQTSTYVTAVLKNNGTTEYALRGGNAQSGSLGTFYKGALPGGWSPMRKQGAIVLGSGGDCCKPGGGANLSDGTFYEGSIVVGYPSDPIEEAVQANIVTAGYGK